VLSVREIIWGKTVFVMPILYLFGNIKKRSVNKQGRFPMSNLNELREAVEIVKQTVPHIEGERDYAGFIRFKVQVEAIETLLALATKVIEAEMPKDLPINPNSNHCSQCGRDFYAFNNGYNNALHDFRLYQTKKRAGLEEVLPDMLAKAQIKVDDTHYDVDIKILAQAIREEMR
jgi:hypothetical protein